MPPDARKEFNRAKRIAFQLLKFRARSQKEIIDRLKKKKISQDTIDKTLELLKKTGLIDDYEFARSWVNACMAKNWGIKRISFDLRNKGIKKEIIEEVLVAIKDKYKEYEVALGLAERRIKSYGDIDKYKARQRIYGFLSRRGFSFDTIHDVMEAL
jgi:regulatory protein